MAELDLTAIAERYHRALDAKPSKGDYTPQGIAAITDSVADVPELLAALEQERRHTATATAMAIARGEERDLLRVQNQRYAQRIADGSRAMQEGLDLALKEVQANIGGVVDRLIALTYASDDDTEYEHNGHVDGEGEPDCPACWAQAIRQALGVGDGQEA